LPTTKDNLHKINKEFNEFIFLSKEDKSNFENIVKSLVEKQILEKFYTQDLGIWNPKKITENRLGWINYDKNIPNILKEGNKFIKDLIKKGYKQVVLIGMGGSSQSAKIFNSFKTLNNHYPELIILDSIHEKDLANLLERLDLEKTIFIISSKSGTTIETQYLFDYFEEVLFGNNIKNLGSHFASITDEGTPLNQLSINKHFRHIFISQKDIGGRFSFATHFGIIPALICGFDVRNNLDNLKIACKSYRSNSTNNPILQLAVLLSLFYKKEKHLLLISHDSKMKHFAEWLEQLIAESNGKELRGIIPILISNLKTENLHWINNQYILLDYLPNTEKVHTLVDNQVPCIQYGTIDPDKILSEMFKWQLVVSIFCYLINVDPFNEPDITYCKTLTLNVLKGKQTMEPRKSISNKNSIQHLLNQLNKNTPLAINVFLPESEILNEKLRIFSDFIRAETGCVTFTGYGPRYLHSTGQIQKGGSKNIHTLFILEKKINTTVLFKSKAQKQIHDLFYLQPEIDIISLKNLGRKVSILDFNGNPINQLNQLIKTLKTISLDSK